MFVWRGERPRLGIGLIGFRLRSAGTRCGMVYAGIQALIGKLGKNRSAIVMA